MDQWAKGFTIMGSSIIEMNGLYERYERDHGLGHWAGVSWRNGQTGWLLLEGERRPSSTCSQLCTLLRRGKTVVLVTHDMHALRRAGTSPATSLTRG